MKGNYELINCYLDEYDYLDAMLYIIYWNQFHTLTIHCVCCLEKPSSCVHWLLAHLRGFSCLITRFINCIVCFGNYRCCYIARAVSELQEAKDSSSTVSSWGCYFRTVWGKSTFFKDQTTWMLRESALEVKTHHLSEGFQPTKHPLIPGYWIRYPTSSDRGTT